MTEKKNIAIEKNLDSEESKIVVAQSEIETPKVEIKNDESAEIEENCLISDFENEPPKKKKSWTKMLQSNVEKDTWSKKDILSIILLLVAGAINSIGVGLLLMPSKVIDAEFSGLAMLINTLTGFNMSLLLLILNIPFYLVAFKLLGKKFIIFSIIGIGAYSFFMFLFLDVLKLCGDNNVSPITQVVILGAMFGGLLSGVGSGLMIRAGGSLDGFDVVALTLSKRVGLSVGTIIMCYNIVMYTIAGFILGFDYPLYSIVAYAVGIKAVDGIVQGIGRAKAAMIITNKGDLMADKINAKLGRGITMLDAKGFFSKSQKTVIYYVVNRFEIAKLKDIVSEIDPEAFVSISDVSEAYGKHLKKR